MKEMGIMSFCKAINEKLQLVEDLWDDLASSPENVPVLEWYIEELERRKKTYHHYRYQLSTGKT